MRTFYAIALVLAGIVFFSSNVNAEELKTCNLEPKIKDLSEVKNFVGTEEEAAKKDLEIRRDILKTVLDCSVSETNNFVSGINSVPGEDRDISALKERINKKLDEVIVFYNSKKESADKVSVEESKILARDIKRERSAVFSPIAEEAINLLIWARNQDLFRVADSRFTQISQTVKRLNLIDQEEIKDRFAEGERTLKRAKTLNDEAKLRMVQGSRGEAISSIRKSLEALSETYQRFFNLSESVQKLLPL